MALLEKKLAPPPSEPAVDRAPDAIAAGVASRCAASSKTLLGADRVLARASDIVRYASDASPYRLFPQAVVMARDAGDVAKVLAYGRRSGIPVTFRAGGTSLNGQGQSDGILVDVRRHFGGVAVEPDRRAREAPRSRPPGPGQARHRARPRQPRARSARSQARPRPGQHRHRLRRRRDRQQLGRDALRHDQGLLLDRVNVSLPVFKLYAFS